MRLAPRLQVMGRLPLRQILSRVAARFFSLHQIGHISFCGFTWRESESVHLRLISAWVGGNHLGRPVIGLLGAMTLVKQCNAVLALSGHAGKN